MPKRWASTSRNSTSAWPVAGIRRGCAQGYGVAALAGATGTPSFVLGYTDLEDPTKVKGITFLRGAKAYASFKAEIDKALPKGAPVKRA